jgi:hypothetical protein
VCVYIYIYIYIYTYIHTSDCMKIVFELLLLQNNTASETFFYANWIGAKCCLPIYYWGAGLAVTGRIHDIELNVLQSSFQTEISNSRSYFKIFFLIAFLEEVLLEI